MTDIQFYFVVLIDIFYYGRGLGHTFGVRVDGPLARGFLRFLSLTAFQAEGGGGGFAAIFKVVLWMLCIATYHNRYGGFYSAP